MIRCSCAKPDTMFLNYTADEQVLEFPIQCPVLVIETAYVVMSKPSDKDILLSYTYSIPGIIPCWCNLRGHLYVSYMQ